VAEYYPDNMLVPPGPKTRGASKARVHSVLAANIAIGGTLIGQVPSSILAPVLAHSQEWESIWTESTAFQGIGNGHAKVLTVEA
jgi:hypothetical protein